MNGKFQSENELDATNKNEIEPFFSKAASITNLVFAFEVFQRRRWQQQQQQQQQIKWNGKHSKHSHKILSTDLYYRVHKQNVGREGEYAQGMALNSTPNCYGTVQ